MNKTEFVENLIVKKTRCILIGATLEPRPIGLYTAYTSDCVTLHMDHCKSDPIILIIRIIVKKLFYFK